MQHENTVELKNTITELQQERDFLRYDLNRTIEERDIARDMAVHLSDTTDDAKRWSAAWKASAKDMRTTLIGMLAYDALPVISDEHLEPVPLTIQPVTLTMKGKVIESEAEMERQYDIESADAANWKSSLGL